MPTTFITNIEANGVGVMSHTLAERVRTINSVLAMRCRTDAKFPELTFAKQCDDVLTWYGKFIYIESSCNLSHYVKGERILVPMWEQGATAIEVPLATTIVSPSKHAQDFIQTKYHRTSEYLPFPTDVPRTWHPVSKIRVILHNAGSLGANFRKGTLEAIRIFQRSGVVKHGVRLVIHAFVPPTPEVESAIHDAPYGITWVNRFEPEMDVIYRGVDLLLHPSKIDGSPLIPREAMARGIPVLVTDEAPINECEIDPDYLLPVARHERSPLAAPYAIVDVEASAEKLRHLCERDLTAKSKEVRAAAKLFSWETLGPKWEALCA